MRGYVYLSAAAAIWGGMYVISKVALDVIPAFVLLWLRYAVALVVLALVLKARCQPWPRDGRTWLWYAAVGAVGYAASIGAQFLGTAWTSAHLGALVTTSSPVFAALMARWSGEQVGGRVWTAVIIALAGVGLVVGGDVIPGSAVATAGASVTAGTTASSLGSSVLFWAGVGCLVVAAATWAGMSVLVQRAESRLPASESDPLVLTAGALVTGWVMVTPIAFMQGMAVGWPALWRILTTPEALGSVLYLGLISTALAFFLWNAGVQYASAARANLFLALQPVVGGLLGHWALDEPLRLTFCVGGAAVLVGLWIAAGTQPGRSES
ncbi:DMT family transporter [Kyrpidia spormannii]|uniref:EamA domain-containing protein n=1 Tax=Kyrpidia spormannii TaxID=2055160 RepID=A0A6F9EGS8_9BACL|nr:DMT family transporter [Kyrpidia spormannii]CAB3396061.1 conserved membrane protein of unknown function [Kyrpidia spormannii]